MNAGVIIFNDCRALQNTQLQHGGQNYRCNAARAVLEAVEDFKYLLCLDSLDGAGSEGVEDTYLECFVPLVLKLEPIPRSR